MTTTTTRRLVVTVSGPDPALSVTMTAWADPQN